MTIETALSIGESVRLDGKAAIVTSITTTTRRVTPKVTTGEVLYVFTLDETGEEVTCVGLDLYRVKHKDEA